MDHWRGRKALGQLPHAVPQHVVIIRQGAAVETLRSDVVVGDVLLLSKGVLSDLHIVRSRAGGYTTWWWR
jgi:magnesium-transporting ATPase (P-type)